jgi:hypothetical protein
MTKGEGRHESTRTLSDRRAESPVCKSCRAISLSLIARLEQPPEVDAQSLRRGWVGLHSDLRYGWDAALLTRWLTLARQTDLPPPAVDGPTVPQGRRSVISIQTRWG